MAIVVHRACCECEAVDGPLLQTWSYKNASLTYTAQMMLCMGSICFSSLGFTTPWHGNSQVDQFGIMTLSFNYRGDTRNLHNTTMFRVTPTVYIGTDYQGRNIRMQHLNTKQYCNRCGFWRVV